MDQEEQIEEGWRQVKAGLALVQWSKLTRWDADRLVLVAADVDSFESEEGHRHVHKTFGRLICWIAFSTGAEYLAKGACFLRGQDLSKRSPVVRIPSPGEDLNVWVQAVNRKAASVQETSIHFGTLGKLPLNSILQGAPDRALVLAAFKLLTKTVRNRDAHRYTENVRAFHFHVVGALFVPALNAILRCLDQAELQAQMSPATNP
jgi:hypothetical protein